MRHQHGKSLTDLESALRLQEAEAIYKKMQHDPDALYMREVIAQAFTFDPADTATHANLNIVLRKRRPASNIEASA